MKLLQNTILFMAMMKNSLNLSEAVMEDSNLLEPLTDYSIFFSSWKNATEVLSFEKFKNFLAAYQKINAYDFKKALAHKEPNFDKSEDFFNSFKKKYDTFLALGGKINVWEVAKLKADELRNCNVLAWFLNANAGHGQGDFFLKAFCETFLESSNSHINSNQYYSVSVEQAFAENSFLHDTFSEQSEEVAKTKKNNRVDIIIESKDLLLFIEAKINAFEGVQQLKRYSEILANKTNYKNRHLIFLTKSGYVPEEYSSFEVAPVGISWKTISKSFETAMRKRLGSTYKTLNQPLWAALAEQFCQHIKTF